MKNFGKYGAVGDIIDYVFKEEPSWIWRIRVSTFEQEMQRDKLLSRFEVATDAEGITRRSGWPTEMEVMAHDIWISFAGSNIPVSGEPVSPEKLNAQTKNLLFPMGAKQERFYMILGELPVKMVREIHAAVIDVNPHWNPSFVEASSSES